MQAIRLFKLFVLTFIGFVLPASILSQGSVVWQNVNGVSIPIPPKEHPRLYLKAEHVPSLTVRKTDPVLKKLWSQLVDLAVDRKPEEIPANKNLAYYFDPKGMAARAELMAMDYLIHGDANTGREAITSVLDSLEKAVYPNISDISRAIGRFMVTGAIVYDWCYDLLTPNEKTRFVNAFVKEAKKLECGYPPVKQGSVVGHTSEWMIMRDLLSAGIAIYDEFPEMYHLAAGRFFKEHLPVRNWFYNAHAYHQGMGYFNVRFGNDLFALWILDRMGAGNVYNPEQQYVMYEIIYKRRPDDQVMPSGDVNHSRTNIKAYPLAALLAGSYYQDPYINYEYQKKARVDNHLKLFEFLWRDTELGLKNPSDLPLTKYFGSPHGWMLARTGWGFNSVIAEMKINEYNFVNHQHNDAGSFQLYYKGPLAIDAGIYQGSSGGYNSEHNKHFFKRTIAHNALLIYDPNERFPSSNYGGSDRTNFVTNDGGQRLPGVGWSAPNDLNDMLTGNFKTGEVLAASMGSDSIQPDYSLLKGDITDAYSSKVEEVKRSFVFLNLKSSTIPAAFIVYDKVVASNPTFKKYWLLHSIEEPQINGHHIQIKRTLNGDKGMLTDTVLLPEPSQADIIPVGGKNKEFWVFGKNYPNEPDANVDEANERGAWRVELSPKHDAKTDYFLNVMQLSDNNHAALHQVKMLTAMKTVGVQIADRVVLFSKDIHLLEDTFKFSFEGNGIFKVLITDLLAADWQIEKDGEFYAKGTAKSGEHTIHFEGEAGIYTVMRADNDSAGIGDKTYQLSSNIYPNPAKHTLYVDLPDDAEEKIISIYQLDGQQKYMHKTQQTTVGISLNDFTQGLYLLQVKTKNQQYLSKFIKN